MLRRCISPGSLQDGTFASYISAMPSGGDGDVAAAPAATDGGAASQAARTQPAAGSQGLLQSLLSQAAEAQRSSQAAAGGGAGDDAAAPPCHVEECEVDDAESSDEEDDAPSLDGSLASFLCAPFFFQHKRYALFLS